MPLNVKWRDKGNVGMILAIIITFVICGLWHGANWTFVVFGFYHGLLFIPLILSGVMFKKTKIEVYKWGFPKWKTLGNMLITFGLVTLGLILIRAETFGQAFEYLKGICSTSVLEVSDLYGKTILCSLLIWISILFIAEWSQRDKLHGLETFGFGWNKWFRYAFYLILALVSIIGSIKGEPSDFIYFKF
jgi:D-alanyl-lipoteichoic acid acyltransferase DltB (MBOAT superfamily)